jgi:hypothetical protein
MDIVQQQLSPCKVFKMKLAKFYQHDGCASCFSRPEQGFEKPSIHYFCRNPSPGLATKAKGCRVAGQEGSPGIMPHAPRNARECERIGPHTPKGTPTLGSWSLNGLPNVQSAITGIKIQWIE